MVGEKVLSYAFAYFAAAVLAAITVIAYTHFTGGDPDGLLGDYGLAEVRSTVPGVDGPAVEQSGQLSVGQQRCIHGDDHIQVEVTIAFVRINGEPGVSIPFLIRAPQTRAPGCNYVFTTWPLPATVEPGLWRLEGISRAVATGEVRYWTTEPFYVTEPR